MPTRRWKGSGDLVLVVGPPRPPHLGEPKVQAEEHPTTRQALPGWRAPRGRRLGGAWCRSRVAAARESHEGAAAWGIYGRKKNANWIEPSDSRGRKKEWG
jgi:hypothetical protein